MTDIKLMIGPIRLRAPVSGLIRIVIGRETAVDLTILEARTLGNFLISLSEMRKPIRFHDKTEGKT